MRLFSPFILALMIAPCAAAPVETVTTETVLPSSNPEIGLKLMKEYRAKPDPRSVPLLMRALSQRGAFKDPEASGVYVGFFAGVLGANPRTAKALMAQTLPLPFEDQWVVVKALAYSGLPQWRELMRDLATKLPNRKTLIEYYLTGKMPTLIDAQLEPEKPDPMAKMKRIFRSETYFGPKKPPEKKRELTFATNPELIDTHWGLYFATGMEGPISRIVTLLPWSKERDSAERLVIGSSAKYTLTNNAARYPDVLATLLEMAPQQDKEVRPALTEVIRAAETVQTASIRKEQLAALEKLKTKGAGYQRDMKLWGYAAQGAIGVGCIVAATMSLTAAGLPCVIGGAAASAGINYWAATQ